MVQINSKQENNIQRGLICERLASKEYFFLKLMVSNCVSSKKSTNHMTTGEMGGEMIVQGKRGKSEKKGCFFSEPTLE
eukprot:763795-Hanusia_phi.AAC.4